MFSFSTFFNNVVMHHWVLSAFSALYLGLGIYLLWFPFKEVFQDSAEINMSGIKQIAFRFVLVPIALLLLGLLLVPVAPIITSIFRLREAKKARRLRAEEEKRSSEMAIAEHNRNVENARRTKLRKEWFAEHPPKLYVKTMNGLTAVLRPAEYEAMSRKTSNARLDGLWDKEDILLIAPETMLFVTEQGREFIESAQAGRSFVRWKIAGYPSALREIADLCNIEQVVADDIFVPFVNESILRFSEQAAILHNYYDTDLIFELLGKQVPKELWPLQ